MSSILDTYARKPISFIRGEGSFLYTEKEEKYLDWVAGIATNIFAVVGCCVPRWRRVLLLTPWLVFYGVGILVLHIFDQ